MHRLLAKFGQQALRSKPGKGEKYTQTYKTPNQSPSWRPGLQDGVNDGQQCSIAHTAQGSGSYAEEHDLSGMPQEESYNFHTISPSIG
jgi:hypothetical protein